ncbi:hypothetical protein CL615_01305 [archaeon]|jgi:hypothetical protein|nr:hypothetical protein [archaeon]MDP6548370.1 hypothetical protein [Candidatus Woesearchaeota archaeon]|tara:strand:- start:8046 stop:8564 length:519 start_codon:yes stop_codon:yes gene_type:complete
MEMEEGPLYKNIISHIDINRGIDSIHYLNFNDISKEPKFDEFLDDINQYNDTIELSLIKNKAYKEAVMMSLHIINAESDFLKEIIRDEQKTFGGSKLFYLNNNHDKILVIAVPGSMENKLNMVINRLNKINEKIHRMNLKIKKENIDMYAKRKSIHDKKDDIINMINKNLKV